jgi:hypothetical protein
MDDSQIEITVGGGPGPRVAEAADHVALALMSAGATVDFPGRPRREAGPDRALRGVRAVVRVAGGMGPGASAAAGRTGLDLATVAKTGVGAVLTLALFDAEVRLRFGLGLDTVATAAAIWWFWRSCLRGAATAAWARS